MRKKICFVALASLPLLTSNDNLKYIGGSELKSVLIGTELAKRDYKIYFITYDEKIEKKMINGITIIKTFPLHPNISGLKKELMIWKSLKEAKADIYIQAIGQIGIIPFFCIINRKKYVRWIASDSDLLLERINKTYPFFSKIIRYFDIKLAHKIIVQNKFQKELTEKRFKKKCVLIKNPITICNNTLINNEKKTILWVGTIRNVKQPEIFLKIAKEFPDINFIMIGGEYLYEKEVFKNIKNESETITNLKFLGFVPHHEIQKYYKNASIFINTSKIEGFPNTFLEAWVNYTPVISLNVDPDEVICNEKLGLHSKTYEQMITDIRTLLCNDNLRNEMGLNAKKYVEQNHDIKKIADQFEKLIESFKK